MKKTITKLSPAQRDALTADFLTSLGKRLRKKRERMNLSQSDLGNCLEVHPTTIGKYENGTRDMQVSFLPLLSVYCDFPLYELFPVDESKVILDTFSKAVSITVERHKRQQAARDKREQKGDRKVLKARVFDVDGHEVYEKVPEEVVVKPHRKEDMYAVVSKGYSPLTDAEFCDFVRAHGADVVDSIMYAGRFLDSIDDSQPRNRLKGAVADYIVDELVLKKGTMDYMDETTCKAYAYYCDKYQKELSAGGDGNRSNESRTSF